MNVVRRITVLRVLHVLGEPSFLSSDGFKEFSDVRDDADTSAWKPFKKYPAKAADLSQTANGEGSFVVIGDWGNPFHPGEYDWEEKHSCWGPHWKCSCGGKSGGCCEHGGECYEEDEMSQVTVAQGMTTWAKDNTAQFVVNVGDNFYPRGLSSDTDDMWGYVFEDRYNDAALQVPWLSVLGNHDYGGYECFFEDGKFTNAQAQIAYDTEPEWEWPNAKLSRWVMPNDHYRKRIVFGNVTIDMFMLDTNGEDGHDGPLNCAINTPGIPNPHKCDVSACKAASVALASANRQFITEEVPKSNATWKFIVAHHPYSMDTEFLVKHKVSAYFCGHTHGMYSRWHGVHNSSDGIEAIPNTVYEMLNGAGGGSYPDGSFNGGRWGFTGVRVKNTGLEIEFVTDQNKLQLIKMPMPCVHFSEAGEQNCDWFAGDWEACDGSMQRRSIWCTGGNHKFCPDSSKPVDSQACTPSSSGGGLSTTTLVAILVPAIILGIAAIVGGLRMARRRRGLCQEGAEALRTGD